MRPVDADVLIPLIQEEKIEGKTLDIIKALGDGLQAETLNQACDRHIKIINSLPTINATSVIRCKDCEWYKKEYGFNCSEYTVCGISSMHHPIVNEDDFCSRGKRKE